MEVNFQTRGWISRIIETASILLTAVHYDEKTPNACDASANGITNRVSFTSWTTVKLTFFG